MHNLLYIYSTWLCSDPELASIYALINGCLPVSLSLYLSLVYGACFEMFWLDNKFQWVAEQFMAHNFRP